MKIQGLTIYADKGKKIAKKGQSQYAEDYGSAFTLLKGETENDFVEILEKDLPSPRPQEPTISRDERINAKIRERYTESNEFAILRQRDTKPEDFSEYNAYCEECKRKVDEEMGGAL